MAPKVPKQQSLSSLISSLPALVIQLVKDHLELFKQETIGKVKKLGVGIALLVVALIILFFTAFVILATIILALSLVLPPWLAALSLAGFMLLLVVILALVGISSLKKGSHLAPEKTIESLKSTIDAVTHPDHQPGASGADSGSQSGNDSQAGGRA